VATVRHGQLVSDKEFRESVGSVIKGLIVIVALSILQSVTCSLLNISTEFWGINLSGWIRIVISTIILGVVVGRYKPLKTIVTFYLIAFVKVGKMPGREKYLEDLIALAGSITLLVFIISIYGYAQPIVSMLNAELIQFGPLNMIINIVVILIVVGILLAVWKRVHPLIDDLTGHITDKVSTLSSFIAYSTCPRCNAKNDHDAAFCIACGAGMQSAEPVVSGGGTCPQCACTNSPESKFCQKCGSPL
jgi:ribosomal protein L40E